VTLIVGSLLSGCGQREVVHQLDEREANQIVELLSENDIEANKAMIDDGRKVSFNIVVAGADRLASIKLLNRNELPRRKDRGYKEIFSEGGLIPTSAEERARKMAALEGEIEKQLKLIDGVLDAQVQIVLPERSALHTDEDRMTPTTASVALRYLPGAGGEKPIGEAQIQALVAAGVEGLTSDKVYPIMTPVRGAEIVAAIVDPTRVSWLSRRSKREVTIITAGVVVVVLVLSLLLVLAQIRMRAVRGRLTRLQAEISRRRGGGDLPAGDPS